MTVPPIVAQSPGSLLDLGIGSEPRRASMLKRPASKRLSLRSAVSVWVALAVVGWTGIIVSAYGIVRVESYSVAIQKLDGGNQTAAAMIERAPASPEISSAELERIFEAAPAAGE